IGLSEKYNKQRQRIFTSVELSKILADEKNFVMAYRELRPSLDVAKVSHHFQTELLVLDALANLFEKSGTKDSALFYTKLTLQREREFFDIRKQSQVDALKIEFETHEKEKQLQISNSEIKYQRTLLAGLTIALVVVAMVSVIAYRSYR